MKTLFAIAAVALCQLALAQHTQEFKELKRIAIKGDLAVTLVKDSQNKVVFGEGSEPGDIKYDNGSLYLEGDGTATLYYKDALESLTVGSDVKVVGKDEIKSKTFTLATGSDSKVAVSFNVSELSVTAGSDAQIALKGKSANAKFTVGSDVQLDAKELESQDVLVTMASDAQVMINAKGEVSAVVASDGQLTIYGNPKNVKETKGSDAKITLVK
ncbi:GIN domain-containing protein [Flavobacterium sp.]|uniref:GIN domain-containing protein n=1 Tax=Flavobacterium sp. TaxID=239 RepID=UPI004033555B